ncbi:MAG: hypothetical protein IJU50_03535 [Lachnospiraceae bacterium]|nr:hypothetical protein [Lachnospiraceae bacterium]
MWSKVVQASYMFFFVLASGIFGCSDLDSYNNYDAQQNQRIEETAAENSQAGAEMEETVEPVWEGESVSSSSQDAGILSSTADINLRNIDGIDRYYVFSYGGEEFSARYKSDVWTITDSYKITSTSDIMIICQALQDIHPIHGRDRKSYRTPADMAFEWQQHNLAYWLLPEGNAWRVRAKSVDLDPDDQGRTFDEIYEDRTGKKFRIEDFIK